VQVWRLPGEPASVGAVRHWLHALLTEWSWLQVSTSLQYEADSTLENEATGSCF